MTDTIPDGAALAPAAARPDGSWHLDKRVPVALLTAILVQSAAFGFWVGGLAARVVHVEQWQSDNRSVDARLAVLEAQTAEIKRMLGRIEDRLLAAPPTTAAARTQAGETLD
jgi:hypothetical protein